MPGITSTQLLRIAAGIMVASVLLYLLNNWLVFWQDWPGIFALFSHLGWFGFSEPAKPLENPQVSRGWIQLCCYVACVFFIVMWALKTRLRTLRDDSDLWSRLAAYIVRAAFWSVFLVGLADMFISFLRVEGMLAQWVGEELNKELGKSRFRGIYVHYPLMGLSLVIAWFSRSLGFTWLALLVVIAEFQIVISRFIFSYEQAFMGDLVRFWYAALFLFASAYALITEGHVRVDVFYTRFTKRGQALANTFGSLLLGLPLCWTILIQGMWEKSYSINSPLLSYEISQSGYGMYVKYLMAGFLVVFAVSMVIQFVSYILSNIADLRNQQDTTGADGRSESSVAA